MLLRAGREHKVLASAGLRRAGGIGFELLAAMNLFQYRTVSMLLIVTCIIGRAAERLSAALRRCIA